MKFIPIFFLLLLLPNSSSDDAFQHTMSSLESFHVNYPQEKIYVFHDKPYYVLGEDLWFSVFACHAVDHTNITPSGLVYVDLLSPAGEVLATRYIQMNKGMGDGDFKLDPNWKEDGDYVIRAYSNYQRNFDASFIFEKSIAIYNSYQEIVNEQRQNTRPTSRRLRVQFFPEGGDLVQGISCRVAVKATGEDLSGTAVKGKIWDQDQNLVTLFVTNDRGFGVFSLKPQEGRRYWAEILEHEGQPPIVLPNAKPAGHQLKIVNNNPDTLLIQARSTLPEGLQDAFVIAHLRGQIIAATRFTSPDNQVLVLPKAEIPSGILHITLFEKGGLPIAERLTFIHHAVRSSQVSIALKQDVYKKREMVDLDLIWQSSQEGATSLASVTVFDQITTNRAANQSDIRSYTWLESDVRGPVEDAAYYFEKNDKKRQKALDLLLMTQGWRRFAWEKICDLEPFKLAHLPENGFTIKGQTTRFLNEKKGTTADLFLSAVGQQFEMLHTQSNADGQFLFTDLRIQDTTAFVLQANRDKDKSGKKKKKREELAPTDKNPVNIALADRSLPKFIPSELTQPSRPSQSALQEFLAQSRYNQIVDQAYANLWTIDLEEIVVREERVIDDIAIHQPTMLYREPDQRLMMDSLPFAAGRTNIFDVINGKFAGVEIIGTYPEKTARIRGINSIELSTTATILLDGAPVSEITANTIPVDRIAFVDVIKSYSKTAIYGRSNGVIAIYTKAARGGQTSWESKTGTLNLEHPGYYRAREFYMPELSGPNAPDKPDYRSTLFWSPQVSLSPEGNSIQFRTADRSSFYQVRLEGLTSTGEPLVATASFRVE